MAKVGLFWGYQGRIYTHQVEVEEGHDDGRFVNGHYDHVDYWPLLSRKHRELAPFAYQDIPRGRVLFVKETETYRVLRDKKLSTDHYRGRIIEVFGLEEEPIEFMHDIHYTTDADELERLFSD